MPSEIDAKEKLIIYVYDYLTSQNAGQAADTFLREIGYDKQMKLLNHDPKSSFLADWWFVFWDLFCAAPDKRNIPPEPTPEARQFYEHHIQTSMSPNVLQSSPSQQAPHFMSPGLPPMHEPPMYGMPISGPHPPHMQPRAMGSRMAQSRGPSPRPPRGPMFMGNRLSYGPPQPQMHHGPMPPHPPSGPNMPVGSPGMNVMMNMGPDNVPPSQDQMSSMNRMTPGGHNSMMPQMGPGPGPSPSSLGNQMMSSGPPINNINQGPGPSPQNRMNQPQQVNWQGGSYDSPHPNEQQCYTSENGDSQLEMGGMMMNDNRGVMEE